MQVETTKKLFTVRDYHRMANAGIFGPEERVELIEGEILEMSPIGHRHMICVNRANRLFITKVGNRAVVSVQNSLELSEYSEPQPDLVLLKPRDDDYAGKKVHAEDTLLVIEVAQTTLGYDQRRKLPLYAAAAVPEVWIEDLKNDLLLVYRQPSKNTYSTSLVLRRGESIAPLALPDVVLSVDELLVETPANLSR
jgi:Uma2 family endonuclease